MLRYHSKPSEIIIYLITGDGPGFGCVRSCACIIKVKNKLDTIIIDFFIFLTIYYLLSALSLAGT